MLVSKKDYIPDKIKKVVWLRHCLQHDIRIGQCATCDNYVLIPASLRKYIKDFNYLDVKYPVSGVGEFGHILSEFNGGKVSEDNLVVQCKTCNTKLGSDNITEINRDCQMIDSVENSDIQNMDIETWGNSCCALVRGGKRTCKNKPLPGCDVCHIHLKK